MGLQGYVGSGEDVRRIRRQEQQLEEERSKREAEKQQREANVSAAGFRQFGKGAAEVHLCPYSSVTLKISSVLTPSAFLADA